MSVLRRSNRVASLRSLFARKHPLRSQPQKTLREHKHSPGAKLAKPRQPRRSNTRGQSSRIEESAAGLASERILQDFSSSMQATRQQIAEEVSSALSSAQQALSKRLSGMIAAYGDDLDTYQATRETFLAPFLSGRGCSQFSDAMGGTRQLSNFSSTHNELLDALRAHEKALEGQWKDWAKIQQKIICLGVEVLGPEVLALGDVQINSTFDKKLQNAASQSDKQVAIEQDIQAALSMQNQHIRGLTKDLLKQSTTQEKKLREFKRKQMEQISLLAKAMIETI